MTANHAYAGEASNAIGISDAWNRQGYFVGLRSETYAWRFSLAIGALQYQLV